MDTPANSNVVLDVLVAIGANLVAFVVGFPIALVAPKFLIFILPFGVFGAYLVLVGLYARAQYKKGRQRRALLAVVVTAVVLMALASVIRVA